MKNNKSLFLGIAAFLTLGIVGCAKSSEPDNESEKITTNSNEKINHTHVFNQKVATEEFLASQATCTEKAKYYYSCIDGIKGNETFEYGEANGHQGEWSIIASATFEKEGEMKKICSLCKHEETKAIPRLPYKRIDVDGNENVEGNYVLFGYYPQTIKADTVEITSQSANSEGYYLGSDGEQYAKVVSIADEFSAAFGFSNGQENKIGQEYYFKVEPIKWRILISTTPDGMAMLLSERILTNEAYRKEEQTEPNKTDNNYEYSEIRPWLNDSFHMQAFTNKQKEIIKTTTVDNRAYTTGDNYNRYASGETNDDVFLLSYKEVRNYDYGFSDNLKRQKKGTDYAKALGLEFKDSKYEGSSSWWLRSPHDSYSNYVCYVDSSGSADLLKYRTMASSTLGIVPVVNIKLL